MTGSWVVVFGGCMLFSFFLSGMEAGVFALSRLRIRHLMRNGNPRARALLGYLERPENFLWTILVGNTLANVGVSSIGVMWLYGWLRAWPWLLIAALVAGALVFYTVCELFPKMLFRHHPNRLCLALVVPFRVVDVALRPVVVPVASLSRLLLRWTVLALRQNPPNRPESPASRRIDQWPAIAVLAHIRRGCTPAPIDGDQPAIVQNRPA